MRHIFFLAPQSTSFWIDGFISKNDFVIVELDEKYIYEIDEILQMINGIATETNDLKIYFISSHNSLMRDYHLSKSLCELGYDSKCQRYDMIQLGIDKLKMKYFLQNNSINTPNWTEQLYSMVHKSYLLKDRYGTAAEGIAHLEKNNFNYYKGKYLEEFRNGIEYSVNVFCNHNKELILYPVVWKGENTENLIPPYKSLRIAGPYNDEFEKISRELYKVCKKVCGLIDNYGFVEFEFIVTEDEILLLEINPRVSGTLRIASMACGSHAFDNYIEERKGMILKPNRISIEIPYSGEYVKSDNMEYVCTTRATFSNDNIDEVIKNVMKVFPDENMVDFYDIEKNVNSLLDI